MKAVDRVRAAARDRGLTIDVREFPEGTKTAEDAARAVGCDVAQIVKTLVFVAGGSPVIAYISGEHRLDTARLAVAAGTADVRRATPDEARAATGFAIGGTPPFGYPAPVPTFMDETLMRFDEVWCAAGTPSTVFPLPPAVLRDASRARVLVLHEGAGDR